MTNPQNPMPAHLPFFITAPGESDVLFTIAIWFLVGGVVLTGVLFFTLHTLPERMAHKSQKIQFEFVAVLGLLALFTHEHIFWVAGLLLAFIEIPDFSHPVRRMADALEKIATEGSGIRSAALSKEADQPLDSNADRPAGETKGSAHA